MKENYFEKQAFESITWDRLDKRTEKFNKENPPINPEDFIDIYGKEVVQKDLKYIQELKNKFEADSTPEKAEVKKHADVLEAVIADQTELNDWMGPDASTIVASEKDDMGNGVDIIVEFLRDNGVSHLALAIDVTHGQDVKNKMERIKKEIKSGKLTEVKYFKSENSGFKGKLEHIPRVIIGADKNTILELGELWLERNNEALAKHKIQFQILEEIKIQLEAFRDYATEQKQHEIANKYAKSLRIIGGIISKKSGNYISEDELRQDKVFSAICDEVKIF